MPIKGNQFKSNSFKQENQAPPPKPKVERPESFWQKLQSFRLSDHEDSKYVKIGGLFCLLMSVYLLIGFTSYLFTWQKIKVM